MEYPKNNYQKRQNDFENIEIRKNKRKRPGKLTYLALFVCIFALLGMFCYQSKIGPFAQDALTHSHVNDSRTKEEAQRDFDKLMDEMFQEEVTDNTITLNYMVKDKAAYGIQESEPTLGEVSMSELKNSLLVSENRIATLETYDYEKLTKEQQLVYDIVYTLSKQNLEAADFLEYTECLGPTTGIQAQLPVYFAEYHFYGREDVEDYIQLLGLVPKYFEQILAFEQEKSKEGIFMSDTTAQAIIEQCSAFVKNPEKNYLITVFNKKIAEVEGISSAEQKAFQEKNKEAVLKSVIPAYQKLTEGLTKLKGTGKNKNGLCHFKKGKAYYAYLVKAATGSSRSLDDINTMLDDNITLLKKEMANIMADSPDVYYDAQDISYPYHEPKKAMEHLKEAIQKDFPALDDSIACEIKYVDKSLEESMSPAFYLTPAIDNYQNNVVYMNQNEKYDLSKAFATIGHESYPGHLYQTCYFQSTNPAPVRSAVNVGGYTEGWGTYAELYSYDLAGIDKEVADLLQKNTVLTLCIYAKADLGVNYLGWNEKKLQSYLSDFGFSKSISRTIFDSMVAEPADYMKYTIGYLEIEEMIESAKKQLGDAFVLKDFHQFFLSTGPAPFSVLQNQMEAWVAEQKGK
ncbi:MAG: DUF885 domain-containing protein [Butyribacter sp.]|nr:DUF885 domain-containing protein [bacterium]MDY3853972.1 DUF885 domain-containing protein [Butyribacter sp.]